MQPSQNVSIAGNFAKISATYFTVKFTNNKCKFSGSSNCSERPSASAAYYCSHLALPTTPIHFYLAAVSTWIKVTDPKCRETQVSGSCESVVGSASDWLSRWRELTLSLLTMANTKIWVTSLIVSFKSTAWEVSFKWWHRRILYKYSKVRAIFFFSSLLTPGMKG